MARAAQRTRPAEGPRPLSEQACGQGGGCDLGDLLRLLGRSHVMEILYIANNEPGPHRFVDLQRRLRMSPNTLSERLKDLVEAGLLKRTAYSELPPRVDYEATAKARDLKPVFHSLVKWARRHDLEAAPPLAASKTTATA
ncbi:MAG TPA: helix-turn-helix domain-containing protein [Candidatus Thermoplasmatota archaeon]|nr:helix-turn-helix domain-containing protein [Candidatus Thermoplasmatota archaeon]